MEMIGTLFIRLRVISGDRARYITILKCIARRQDCDDEATWFFSENPGVKRQECVMEWVYRDIL
jgi:hypothetical protein